MLVDLYECNFNKLYNHSISDIQKDISELIKNNNLQELRNYYHFFGPGAISEVISLAESHTTLHSWPEFDYVSLDIFVCNFNRNNKKNALSLYKDLIGFFEPKEIRKRLYLDSLCLYD